MEETSTRVNKTYQNYFKTERVETEYQKALESYMKEHRAKAGLDDEGSPNIYEYLQSNKKDVGRYANSLNYENLLYLLRECDLTIEGMYKVLGLSLPAVSDDVQLIYDTCSRLSEDGRKILHFTAYKMTPSWWRTNEEVNQMQFAPSARLIHAEKRLYPDKVARTGPFESMIDEKFPAPADGTENPIAKKAKIAWDDRHMRSAFGLPAIPYVAEFVGAPLHWAFSVSLVSAKLKEKTRNGYYRNRQMLEVVLPDIPYRTDAKYVEPIVDAYGFMGKQNKDTFCRTLQQLNSDLDAGLVPEHLVAMG